MIVRPSFQENLYVTLFQLESDRPMYYAFVVRIGRSLFLSLGYDDEVKKIERLIWEEIEKPYKVPFKVLIDAYYNPRFMYSKNAYTEVGDNIDFREVTRYEIGLKLEKIKDYIYDRATQISSLIRFTQTSQNMMQ